MQAHTYIFCTIKIIYFLIILTRAILTMKSEKITIFLDDFFMIVYWKLKKKIDAKQRLIKCNVYKLLRVLNMFCIIVRDNKFILQF